MPYACAQREQATKKQRMQTGPGLHGAAPAAPDSKAETIGEPIDGDQPGPSALRFDIPTGMSAALTFPTPALPRGWIADTSVMP